MAMRIGGSLAKRFAQRLDQPRSLWQAQLLAIVAIALLSSLANAQTTTEHAIRSTYGDSTLQSSSGMDTAAAFSTRQGPDIVLVRRPPGELPIPIFRLTSVIDELPFTLEDPRRFREYEVDHLQVINSLQDQHSWLIARLTCSCGPEILYLGVGRLTTRFVDVYSFTVDATKAPLLVSSVPETPSLERSLLGLALADGMLTTFNAGGQVPEFSLASKVIGFVPDPDRDCVACALRGANVDSLEVHVVRHYGRVLPDSRREWSSRQGRFLIVVIEGYELFKDTLVLREHRGRISVVYQFSGSRIPEAEYPRPGLPGATYLWVPAIGLGDANEDGYPELYGTQICHCGMEALQLAAIDFAHNKAVFMEYPYWGTSPEFIPYIRSIPNPTSDQDEMQAGLSFLLDLEKLRWTLDPGGAVPLGATVEIRAGTLVPFH